MNNFDLISIGDSTIDVFMQVESRDTETVCKVKEEECLICFAYGSKIPVSTCQRIAAVGNAANNAIGSARLGLNTAIYTVLGSDQDSEESKRVFEEEGVDTRYVVTENGKRSNFSVVINYSGERTIFVYHEPHKYDFPQDVGASWVYLTSVGKDHNSLHEQIVAWVKSSGAKLGFNPGSHQLKDGLEGLKPVLEVTEVLSVNKEEAQGLGGPHSAQGSAGQEEVKELLGELKKVVPGTIVITDGPEGSYASIDGREVWFVGIPASAPIVERTGAGDAYTTGFIAATARGLDLPTAMIWGTLNATSVVAHIGAREGLLTPMQMEGFIKQYGSEIKPRMV